MHFGNMESSFLGDSSFSEKSMNFEQFQVVSFSKEFRTILIKRLYVNRTLS